MLNKELHKIKAEKSIALKKRRLHDNVYFEERLTLFF